MGGFAWVTLATNDSYSLGALVLAHSLRRVNTPHQLVVLITPGVSEAMKTQLSAVFNVVKVVDVLDSGDTDNLALLARPELGITFTKLHCWKLTQFEKCVFLDADTLVLQNSDELFEREELSAAPDVGWPDCFNSGVFVYKPSNDTFKALIEFALHHGSFDGGDQGLLNLFFSDWPTKDISKHLSFVYNMVSTTIYSYLPAFKQFGHGLKILHFIGSAKPWLQPFNTETGHVQTRVGSQHITQFLQLWWDLFCTNVHPSLSTEMAGLAGALASVTLGTPLSAEQAALEEHLRRQEWEQGHIDYMGKDSFSNIWRKICETLTAIKISPAEVPAPVAPVAAPTFVSSVEISPSGPIDTSPPASYAPVSVPKPTTVEAPVAEAATKVAASAEAETIIAEQKSSFAEIVSTSSDSSEKLSATEVSTETPIALSSAPPLELSLQTPATFVQPTPADVQNSIITTLETQSKSMTLASAPDKNEKEPPKIADIQTAKMADGLATIDPVLAPTPSSITPTPTTIHSPAPMQPTHISTAILDASVLPKILPSSTQRSDTSITPPIPTSAEPQINVSVSLPSIPSVTPIQPSVLPIQISSEPQGNVPSFLPSLPNVTPIQPPVPSSQASTEHQINVLDLIPSPPTSLNTEASDPIQSAPLEALGQAQQTPKPQVAESTTAKESVHPPLTLLSTSTNTNSSQPIPPEQVQPETPTVTEPTPPTSPPAATIASLLTSKLQVESEVPATPPVGTSTKEPAIHPSDEPPVPPKRKGGPKGTQADTKGQKGKPSKGKK